MDKLALIKYPIQADLDEFKRLFDSALVSSNPLLNHVVDHLRQRNGKMMRPILIFLISRLYGQVVPETYFAAVSLELLHTASLVHDDVVDESTERRGQLSVNAIFNNKVSILVGDYMLATSLVFSEKTKNHSIIEVISKLGQDLSGGEILQLSNLDNTDFSEEIYFNVIKQKTAALFAACTTSAMLSIQAPEDTVDFARQFGEYIGICFQIRDDIFDYFDSKEIGKPTGNDMLEGKLTLPALYALNHVRNEQMTEIGLKIKKGHATIAEIKDLIAFVKTSGGIEYAEQTMESYHSKASAMLNTLPPSVYVESLQHYLDFVVDRRK